MAYRRFEVWKSAVVRWYLAMGDDRQDQKTLSGLGIRQEMLKRCEALTKGQDLFWKLDYFCLSILSWWAYKNNHNSYEVAD